VCIDNVHLIGFRDTPTKGKRTWILRGAPEQLGKFVFSVTGKVTRGEYLVVTATVNADTASPRAVIIGKKIDNSCVVLADGKIKHIDGLYETTDLLERVGEVSF